ncbi:hypothetical protein FACS1894162_2690 [Bacteroidia bacterium]|nr:hypothetical protein FACS1894162_2690 [Bacteroidia bacterium]
MGVVIAICLLIPFFSGCSDDEKSTDVYYITVGQTDVNFTSNLYLQAEITDLIATTSGSNQRYKLCTESEAKSWLNQVVTEIKKPAFIADIPLLKTTFTLEATQAASDPDAKGKVVASQQITLEK